MARIKIDDLPENQELDREELREVLGGTDLYLGISTTESDMDIIRNTRQSSNTTFENFDQKASQLSNILGTVVKSIEEQENSITKNIN